LFRGWIRLRIYPGQQFSNSTLSLPLTSHPPAHQTSKAANHTFLGNLPTQAPVFISVQGIHPSPP